MADTQRPELEQAPADRGLGPGAALGLMLLLVLGFGTGWAAYAFLGPA